MCCSKVRFFFNPREEKLLSKPEYNKLFAYAYFVGLAQWAYGGIPEAEMVNPEPDAKLTEKTPQIEFSYSDGLHERESWMLERHQVFTESINLYLDDEERDITVLRKKNRIRYTPENPLSNGEHSVRVSLRNMYGNHNLLRDWRFTVHAWDADGEPVADSDTIRLKTSYGIFEELARPAKNGRAVFYLHAGENPATASVRAMTGHAADSLYIEFIRDSLSDFEGEVGNDTPAIPGATVKIDTLELMTDDQGHFFTDMLHPGQYQVGITRRGYFGTYQNVKIKPGRATILNTGLEPVAAGNPRYEVYGAGTRNGAHQQSRCG